MSMDARIIHELEQFVSGMRDLAPILAETRDILMENGYSREEAVEGSFRVLDAVLRMTDEDDAISS